MIEAATQSWYMLVRQARNLLREPIWIALLLIQPMVWLLLYSQLFKRVTDLGGFGTHSYADFFLPGVVVMTRSSPARGPGCRWSPTSIVA